MTKARTLFLVFTKKIAFNINGTTIYFASYIPINQTLEKLTNFSLDMLKKFIDQYEQFQFIVLDEISLVDARMLHATDQRPCSIMHVQIDFLEVKMSLRHVRFIKIL